MEILEQFVDNLVAITAVLLPFLIILIILLFSRRKEQDRNQLIKSLLDKGYDPEAIHSLLDKGNNGKNKSPEKYFRSGVTLVVIGVGLILTWLLAGWGSMHAIGAFVGVIGLGDLAIAWYLRKYSK